MNVLAHLVLAGDDPACRLGNLLGDHARGRIETLDYPEDILRGIRMHRSIDAFTDAHPVNREINGLLRPEVGRYAPILVDMYHDHFLARDFESVTGGPLREFADAMYEELTDPPVDLPGSLCTFIGAMAFHDILASYEHPDGIAEALLRIGARTRRHADLARPGLRMLVEHEETLEQAFRDFWPDLEAHVEAF